MAGRGAWRRDGGAWRAETTWRHRRLPRLRMPSHIALQCADASLLPPCPSGRCWRRRRHRTCVHRRARWCAPPWGTQRRTRHCRITTVSSTCSFHRRGRRRRRLRGRQAAGRGTTFGAGCAAQRAASAPSSPHLHSTRARSAPSIRAAGTSWPDMGVRAQLLRYKCRLGVWRRVYLRAAKVITRADERAEFGCAHADESGGDCALEALERDGGVEIEGVLDELDELEERRLVRARPRVVWVVQLEKPSEASRP
jgi:hypothetical protein